MYLGKAGSLLYFGECKEPSESKVKSAIVSIEGSQKGGCMESFKNWSIGKKMGLAQFGVILTSFMVVTIFVTAFIAASSKKSEENDLRTQMAMTIEMIDSYRSVLEEKAVTLFSVFSASFAGKFTLDDGILMDINGVAAPVLRNSGVVVDLNYSEVDRLTQVTGATAAVFAKKGDDYIRVTTSLKKEDGSRAIGTLLERGHPAYDHLMKGEGYVGKAILFGKDYMTKYAPIKDDSGNTIGALYIGCDFTEGLKTLKDKINALKIGETGFIYVLNAAEGKDKGVLVIHPTEQGKMMLGEEDVKGKKYVDEMIHLKNGAIDHYSYAQKDGKTVAQENSSIYSYYRPWEWIVAVGHKHEEHARVAKRLGLYVLLISITTAVLMAFLLQRLTVRWVLNPISKVMRIAKDIAEGKENVTKKLQVTNQDEIGALAGSFNAMTESIVALIVRIQNVADSINSSSREILVTSQEQAAAAREQSSAVTETTAAAKELSVTSEQVGESIKKVAQAAAHALAGMAKIKETTARTNLMLSSLGEKSQKIGKITELIDDVADQTNLLAVNASIEAARAGDQGRGFMVVADEIRKLADSTAKSTKDITALIELIQHEMSNAIMSMEQGVTSVDEEARLAQQTTEKAKEIAMSTHQQASGSKQIADAMMNIDEAMKQIATGAQHSQAAVKQLTELAEDLGQAASKFRL